MNDQTVVEDLAAGLNHPALPRVLMISFLSYPLEGGEKQGRLLAAELRRQGVEVELAAARLPGMPGHEVLGGVPIQRLPCWPWVRYIRRFVAFPLYGLALAAYLRRSADRWDLFHIHGAFDFSAGPAAAVGRRLGKPVVVKQASLFDDDVARAGFLGGWRVRQARLADAHVANSPAVYAAMTAQLGLPPERCHYIPNGVALPEKVARQAARLRLGLDPGVPLAVCVSSFSGQKNQAALVRARPDVLVYQPEAQLLLVGEGPLQRACAAEVARLGLGARVRFAGRQADVSLYLDAADLFIFPSLSEGMPNALMEAMAHGLPCVVSAIAGSLALVTPGVDGLAYDPAHEARLAECVCALLGDPAQAQRLGAAARRKMGAEFGMDLAARRYLKLYQRLLG